MKMFPLLAAAALALASVSCGDSQKKAVNDITNEIASEGEKLQKILSSVTDRASAEKAVQDIKAALPELKALAERAKGLSPEESAEVKKQIQERMKAMTGSFTGMVTGVQNKGAEVIKRSEVIPVFLRAKDELMPQIDEIRKILAETK